MGSVAAARRDDRVATSGWGPRTPLQRMDETQIESLIRQTLTLDGDARRAFLDEHCGNDAELRSKMESLLAHADSMFASFARGKPFPSDLPGSADGTFGSYRLIRELGRGGQGVVWLAEDPNLGRRVAVKVLRNRGPMSPELLSRFKREALVASRLQHPALCTIHDAGTENGTPYIVMQYVEGQSLASRISRDKLQRTPGSEGATHDGEASSRTPTTPVTPSSRRGAAGRARVLATLRLMESVCRATHVAHEAGVIHRDIKPGNIMVRADGEPVLMDFGLARDEDDASAALTRSGDVLGTPVYMAPEQISRQHATVDRRADVWALGVTLFEAITLERPFASPTRQGLYRSILNDDPPDIRRLEPSAPADLRVVVETALEKNQDQRYQTALALAEDLRRVREHEPILARPITSLGRARRWAERNPWLAASLAGIILVLTVALIVTLDLLRAANASETAARSAEARSRRDAYRANYTAAFQAFASHDYRACRTHLDLAAPDLRRFEWRRLNWIADRSAKTLQAPHVVVRLAFTADDDSLVTLGVDHSVSRWDLATGARQDVVSPTNGGLRIDEISPDGRLGMTFDPPAAFDLQTGREIWQRPDVHHVVRGAFSTDGRTLTLLTDNGGRVVRVASDSGDDVASWPVSVNTVETPEITGDESSVILASAYGTFALDARTGSLRWRSPEASGRTFGGGFVLADPIERQTGLKLLGVQDGVPKWSSQPATSLSAGAHARSPSGRGLASGEASGAIALRDPSTGTVVAMLEGHVAVVTRVAYSHAGGWLVSAAQDRTVKLWPTALHEATPVVPPSGDVSLAGTFAPRSRLGVSVGWGSITLWDLVTGALRWSASPSPTWLHACAFSPDESMVAVAGDGRRVHVLGIDGREIAFANERLPATCTALAWLPDGTAILAGCGDGSVVVIRRAQAGGTTRLGTCSGAIRRMIVVGDGRLVAVAADAPDPAAAPVSRPSAEIVHGPLEIWDLASGDSVHVLAGHAGSVRTLTATPDGGHVASGGDDGRVFSWNVDTGAATATTSLPAGGVVASTYLPEESRVAFAGADGALYLWDMDDTAPLLLDRPPRALSVNAIAWVAGALVASTGNGLRFCEGAVPDADLVARERVRATRDLVEPLFGTRVLVERVTRALEDDASLPDDVRADAVARARARGDHPTQLNSQAWDLARNRTTDPDGVALALRAAEIVCKAWPEQAGFLNTRGVAEYRAGKFTDAIATLERCNQMQRTLIGAPHPLDLVVLAMAQFKAGKMDEARATLQLARERIREPEFATDGDIAAFLREAEALIPER